MAVSLEKIEREAPHLVDLVKATGVSLQKSGVDPETSKAAVIAIIDSSLSTEQLFASGEIQGVADLSFAAGLVFDDDGDVPVSFFENRVHSEGVINLQNCKNYIRNTQPPVRGGTSYIDALQWIIKEAGYAKVNISTTQTKSSGLFHKTTTQTVEPLSVKATAAYPTFAIFITDGEPNRGTEKDIVQLLTEMSQLPIFVQFIGVGKHSFSFLHSLDDLEGRLVDNAGFFDSKNASNQDQMLTGLLKEFATKYYPAARSAGLIT